MEKPETRAPEMSRRAAMLIPMRCTARLVLVLTLALTIASCANKLVYHGRYLHEPWRDLVESGQLFSGFLDPFIRAFPKRDFLRQQDMQCVNGDYQLKPAALSYQGRPVTQQELMQVATTTALRPAYTAEEGAWTGWYRGFNPEQDNSLLLLAGGVAVGAAGGGSAVGQAGLSVAAGSASKADSPAQLISKKRRKVLIDKLTERWGEYLEPMRMLKSEKNKDALKSNLSPEAIRNYYFRNLYRFAAIVPNLNYSSLLPQEHPDRTDPDNQQYANVLVVGGIAMLRNNYDHLEPEHKASLEAYRNTPEIRSAAKFPYADEYSYLLWIGYGKFPDFFGDIASRSSSTSALYHPNLNDVTHGEEQEYTGEKQLAVLPDVIDSRLFLEQRDELLLVVPSFFRKWEKETLGSVDDVALRFCDADKAREVRDMIKHYHQLQFSQTQEEKKAVYDALQPIDFSLLNNYQLYEEWKNW